MVAALLPLTFSIRAADTDQLYTDKTMAVPVTEKTIIPVDLDQAATAQDVVLPQQPVHMTADNLLVRNSDGYVKSRGNVDIQQGMEEVHANYVEGNTNTGIYHMTGPVVYVNETNALTGKDVTYNSKTSSMNMDNIEGFIGPTTYIRGTDAEMYDNIGYVKHGLITTPHAVAKTPDYYITGDDIRIYPGESLRLKIQRCGLSTSACLRMAITKAASIIGRIRGLIFSPCCPRPTYNSDDGFGVRGYADIPLNESGDLSFYASYALTTKNGFKPARPDPEEYQNRDLPLRFARKKSTDNDDNIWATKWPELEYFAPRINLGSTGIYIDSRASWGRWAEDGVKTGTHKGFRTEITHVPIHLWTKANLRFFAGYRKDLYSTKDAQRRDPYSGVILNQGINDRLWTSFWYKKHNVSGYTPYRFDTLDKPRQKGFSVGYVLTPRDTVIFSLAQNLDNNDIATRNYTWVRDLHSFIAIITYKQVEKEWQVKVQAKDFDL